MSIKAFIKNKIESDFHLEDDLPFPTTQLHIPKNTVVTRYGQVENNAYFLLNGIIKISMLRQDGEEKILEFFFPHSFFSAYTSFLTRKPSNVQIETLSDCECEVIQYS